MAKLTRDETITLLEAAIATVTVAIEGCPRQDFNARTANHVGSIGSKIANGIAGLAIAVAELEKEEDLMPAPTVPKLSALWLINRPLAVQTIGAALTKYRGNISIACESLGGVNPRTIYRWAKDSPELTAEIRKARLLALHG